MIKNTSFPLYGLALLSPLLLSACGGGSESEKAPAPQVETPTTSCVESVSGCPNVAIAGISSDFTSSEIVYSKQAEFGSTGNEAISDIAVSAHDGYFYRIGRFGLDFVEKYAFSQPQTAIWRYSTKAEPNEASANPQALAVYNNTGYLATYGGDLLILDINADSQSDFIIGRIDLSEYDPADGVAEAIDIIEIQGEIYLLLQRLESFSAVKSGMVLVIDTDTNTVTDSVELKTNNPGTLNYLTGTNGLFVSSAGAYGFGETPAQYTGGIEVVDLNTLESEVILDDGDNEAHPYGQITDVAIVDSSLGYFLGYDNWAEISLYDFNPSTGDVYGAIANYAGIDIRDIEVVGDSLWLAIGDTGEAGEAGKGSRIEVMDFANDSVRVLPLNTVPSNIAVDK